MLAPRQKKRRLGRRWRGAAARLQPGGADPTPGSVSRLHYNYPVAGGLGEMRGKVRWEQAVEIIFRGKEISQRPTTER